MVEEFDTSKYYQGRPCKRGHVGIRLLSNSSCVECTKIISARSYSKNKERRKKQMLNWHQINPERSKAHRDKLIASGKKGLWWKINRKYANALEAKRRAAKLKATPMWADQNAIKAMYANCPKGMAVDHIVPLQSELVCGLHVEWNLQYLTKEANSSKSNKFWPDMP